MKLYRLILIFAILIGTYQSVFSACTMETSGLVDMGTGSWTVYDINNLDIASGLGTTGIVNDFQSAISGYTFSLSGYTLKAEGENLDPTTWSLVAVDGRLDAFSGSCDSTIENGETVITFEDLQMLNIFEISALIVCGLFISILFILKQI